MPSFLRLRRTASPYLPAIVATAMLVGCAQPRQAESASADRSGFFEDATSAAGIAFVHTNGDSGRFLFPETFGGGCAFLDYDEDGDLDAALLSCGRLGGPEAEQGRLTLYRNEGNGRFTDATPGSGLDKPLRYAQAVAVGDYDNDGFSDLFVASYGGHFLFHNLGSTPRRPLSTPGATAPAFEDVTESAGLSEHDQNSRWASGAAFGDYDRDGRLDLVVIRYAKWSPEIDRRCPRPDGSPGYCVPDVYDGDSISLYRNVDGRRFEDASLRAGLARIRGRGLAVCWIDYDGDGSEDVFVANDLDPNTLLRNLGNGVFSEVAAESGAAFGGDGLVASGMGIAAGDYDHTGRESLLIPNLNGERFTLLHAEPSGMFSYATETAGLSTATISHSGWGAAFLDLNRDGWADLVTANGNVHPAVAADLPGITYAEPKGVFLNTGNGGFRDASAESGAMRQPRASRGMAVGDYDGDGRIDVLCVNRNERADLFRNMSTDSGHWINVRLVGVKSNRDGAGAKVRLSAGGMRQYAECRLSSSYASSSDKRLFFGLGAADRIAELEVKWPSGVHDLHKDLSVDQVLTIREGEPKPQQAARK